MTSLMKQEQAYARPSNVHCNYFSCEHAINTSAFMQEMALAEPYERLDRKKKY